MRSLTPSEDQVHVSILQWLKLQRWVLAFHVPNGGKRGGLAGAQMKKLGALAGAPDLVVLYRAADTPRTLLVEVKKPGKGRLSREQNDFAATCALLGHSYIVVRSLEDVMDWWRANA